MSKNSTGITKYLKVNETYNLPLKHTIIKIVVSGKNFKTDKLIEVFAVKFKGIEVMDSIHVNLKSENNGLELGKLAFFLENTSIVSYKPIFLAKYILQNMFSHEIVKPNFNVINLSNIFDYLETNEKNNIEDFIVTEGFTLNKDRKIMEEITSTSLSYISCKNNINKKLEEIISLYNL